MAECENKNATEETTSKQGEVLSEEVLTEEVTAEESSSETTAEDVSTETTSTEEDAKKKGFFSKKEKKDKKDEQIADLTDKLKRNMAEFDNYRKRTEKEKTAMYEVGAKAVVEKILPTIDNFERGLKAVPEESKGTPFADGMEMIYKQLLKSLSEIGVEPIEAVGKEFDPSLHNAVMHIENDEVGENVVVQEFQKGYTYKGTVVRYSMVQVAN